MSSSSNCSIDDSSDSEVVINARTPRKRRYKRSLHHGLNKVRSRHYKVTPEKPKVDINRSNSQPDFSSGNEHSEMDCGLDLSNSCSTSSVSDTDIFQLDVSSHSHTDISSDSDTVSDNSLSSPEEVQTENEEDVQTEREHHDKPLYDGSNHTVHSSYTMIMLYVMKHSLVNEAFSDLLLLISSLLPETAHFTKSVYKVKETLKTTISFQKPQVHNYCEKCQQYCLPGNICENVVCRRNNATMLQFHDLRMVEQLKYMFEDGAFLNILMRQQQRTSENNIISDIVDGQIYKDTIRPLRSSADLNLTFTMNTDGVALFSSSKKGSLWPVYLAINELPIKLRFSRKYLIPCYLHCQEEKPNMLTYLSPMMTTLENLHTKGFEIVTSLGKLHIKCHLIAASLDLPARALVSNMKQYNGKQSCTVCLDEGACPPGNPLHRFYPFNDDSLPRTHISMLRDAEEASRTGAAVHGIKGASPLVVLKYIDLPRVFVIDWMHCVLLGVTKALMSFWLDRKHKHKTFFIGNKINLLNERLLKIKIPDFVSRRQRPLEEHKHWKASECREWLIHFSVPVLFGIQSPTPYVHYLLLVTAMCLLTKTSMSLEDIDLAEDLLKGFTKTFPVIYGMEAQTMNVHLLKHLAGFSRLHGPLFSYSCFGFESMNSFLKKMVHGTCHVSSQICFAVGMSKQISSLVRKFTDDNSTHSSIRDLAKQLGSKFMQEDKAHVPGGEVQLLGRRKPLDETHYSYVLLTPEMRASSPSSAMRLRKGDNVYFCKDYQLTKTKNSYTVCFLNGDTENYGFIMCFIQVNGHIYAVVEVCRTEIFSLQDEVKESVTDIGLIPYLGKTLCPNVVRVLSHEARVLVSVNDLLNKCVLIEVKPTLMFISNPPNLLEHG